LAEVQYDASAPNSSSGIPGEPRPSGSGQGAGEAAEPRASAAATQIPSAVQASGTTLMKGAQDMTQEWAMQAQAVFQRNLDTVNALMRARSITEAMAIQDRFLRETFDSMLQGSRRLSELMVATTSDTMRGTAPSQPGR